MTTVKLMLNKDRILKSGQYPLVFQIIRNRKKKLIYTDIRLLEGEFDSDKGKIRHVKGGLSYQKIAIYNKQVRETQHHIYQLVKKLEDKYPQYSVEDIVTYYNRQCKTQFIIPYMEEQVKKKEKIGKDGTAEAYRSTKNSLRKFIGDRQIRFIDITYDFLENYMQFLAENGNVPNTIAFYMRNFKSMYNRGKKQGLKVVANNPFEEMMLKTDKTLKRSLSREELKRIIALDLSPDTKYGLARDLFLFSFYARGMAFVDIIFLKKADLINDIMYYRRTKTNQPLQVSLTDALEYLMKKHENEGEYVFPILDPTKKTSLYKQYRNALNTIDKSLKVVGKLAGIKASLTTYWARHTWATMANETGAPISHISGGLGHTSEKTTRIYLNDLDINTLRDLNAKVTDL